MPRLFVDQLIQEKCPIELTPAQKHYLTKVMRLRPAQTCHIFNAASGEWLATLENNKFLPQTCLRQPEKIPSTAPTLLFAPVKLGKLEWMIQKATEMGCQRLAPIATERSIVRHINRAKACSYAIEAAEQCHLLYVPFLEPMQALSAWLDKIEEKPRDKLFFCDEALAGEKPSRKGFQNSFDNGFILIGPEGGFSKKERLRINAMPNSCPLPLGPRILRADTAIVAALTIYQSNLGDWLA